MIGLVAHAKKPAAEEIVRNILREFEEADLKVLLENGTATLVGRAPEFSIRDLGDACELIVVLGGDGTLLRVAHALQGFTKPLLGINLGSLGFLTCVSSQDYRLAVRSVLEKSYQLSLRSLLEVQVLRQGEAVAVSTCLNDAVVNRGAHSRLISVDAWIDGILLTRYHADGLIVATPTGSTAYSMSAGGPILMPQSGVFVLTPICPHVLTNRSVIVAQSSVLELRPVEGEPEDLFLNVDGQQIIALRQGDTVRIHCSETKLPLVMLNDFPDLLRKKLKWSGSNIL